MIVWINGAFGTGKTTTAYELHRRIPGSFVYDPEEVGYFIRKNSPVSVHKSDFQDYPLWRETNLSMLGMIEREHPGVVIVPMTLVKPQYFREIVGALRAEGVEVRHFALLARRETLLQRLKGRGDGSDSWPAQQIDRCLEALSAEAFGMHLHTDEMTPDDVVERIAAECGIELQAGS
ncbi:AAA family ATPase [Saccharibacillus sp. CPCC 101409]|uniref:AAA family ATPase n=1 Tax=Saccharibacillus sp. CPCC 101409 TaxID=3058041 RepID=UPI0026714CBE|nr:AAA family ATPase [Saccharibacillus sp. CPCC 101409]MDO3412503.1 AAA family ATPase [Saccharibacillus sp. CPCC 101409]